MALELKDIIALTGNIGSGKSTAAKIFASKGAVIIDADLLARAASAQPTTLEQIRSVFGSELLNSDGSLNRSKLASVVFKNKAELKKLEEIIHPQVHKLLLNELANLPITSKPVIYVVPLFFESEHLRKVIPRSILVTCPKATALQRVCLRDGSSIEHATARYEAQMPQSQKERLATWILPNDSDREALSAAIDQLYPLLNT